MAYVSQLKIKTRVFTGPSKGPWGRWTFVQAVLALSIVFIGAASISAQDLGALAGEERARKQAEPPHEVHVYTNDDLARPKILVPEDDSKIRNEQVTPEPSAAKSVHEEARQTVPPPAPLEGIAKIGTEQVAPEADNSAAPLAEAAQPDSPPAPLGDIARRYREQKLAGQLHAQVEAQPSRSSHVYTNEDLARPTILTPEDHEVFEAAQKKLIPAMEQKALEIGVMEQGQFGLSLGDIARLHRRQVPIPQISQPNRFPLLLGMTAFGAPAIAKSVIRPPLRVSHGVTRVVRPVSGKFRLRRTAQRLTRTENLADQTITVKPGDTLWSLARQYLGQGNRWRELQKSNSRNRDPHYLRIGSQIRI